MFTQQSAHTPNWGWAETDLTLLLQQFRTLRVTQQYQERQQELSALGLEGRQPLAKAQMEMLSKVVDDFLVQLGPAADLPQDTDQELQWQEQDQEVVLAAQAVPQQVSPRQAVPAKPQAAQLTRNQVQKNKGLQKQRESLKAGIVRQTFAPLCKCKVPA